MTVVCFGQIKTTKVATRTDKSDYAPYDSTVNFLGKKVFKYFNQELYLKGKPELLRKYGYDHFVVDYNENRIGTKNVYKCCDNYNSKYSELAGTYFKVIEVIRHPKASEIESLYGKKFFLKLEDKSTEEISYFEYDTEFEFEFPFIVVGYFEKQKKLLIGKDFIIKDKLLEGVTDIGTGNEVTINSGENWKCTDLTVEQLNYDLSLILQNSVGQKIAISLDLFHNKLIKNAFSISEANQYKKKFGINNFSKILKGVVTIGMTKEMCTLSWGEPNSINETITAGKKSEQWVYSGNYLYFVNGVLTTIQ